MQKETVIIVVAVAAISGWMFRDSIMNKVNPPVQEVNTADLAPPGSRYSTDNSQRPVEKGGIYSWKDKDGKVHFGNRDVADDAESVQLSKGNTIHLSGKPAGKDTAHTAEPASSARSGGVKPINQPERVRQKLNSAAEQQQRQVELMTETMQ